MGVFTMRFNGLLPLLVLLGAGSAAAQSPTYGLGRTPTPEEVRAWDIAISPTGEELPPGSGNARPGGERSPRCRPMGLGTDPADPIALRDGRVGLHLSGNASRRPRNAYRRS